MATKPFHYFKKPNLDTQAWPTDVNSGTTIDAESFVYYDTTAGFVLPLNNDVNGANFVGQTQDQNPVNVYGAGWQQGGGSTPPNVQTGTLIVNRYGQTLAKATGSEAYSPGTAVGIGADAQTISTAASNKFAFVSGDQTPVASATAGQLILVDFRAIYPNVAVR